MSSMITALPQNLDHVAQSQIPTSSVPTSLELELLELIVNHRVTLASVTLSFSDIINQLEIEFSPYKKQKTETIHVSTLQYQLSKLKQAKAVVDREINEVHSQIRNLSHDDPKFKQLLSLMDFLGVRQECIGSLISKLEAQIQSGRSEVEVPTDVMGEFVPSSSPRVILYYNNIPCITKDKRYQMLLGTFVHEMMHAWNYFMSKGNARTVLAVDEPMVEFAALFFLESLSTEASQASHKLSEELKSILKYRVSVVREKQYAMGSTAAYGYGCYLYENLDLQRKLWIEAYSVKASDISATDKCVQDFQNALVPCYSFNEELEMKKLLEMIIFGGKVPKAKPTSLSVIGRHVPHYPMTKSDPICKWRVASVETVIELVSLLPKTRMPKENFRSHMSHAYGGAFFRTPYQLALQLGLYYEDDVEFIPRFDHDITVGEATGYMYIWMERYYVPNPFTKRGFVGVCPSKNLLNALVDYIDSHPGTANLRHASICLFGGEMGNISSVKYVLNQYSKIIEVDSDDNMILFRKIVGPVDVPHLRDDKKAFFEHFK